MMFLLPLLLRYNTIKTSEKAYCWEIVTESTPTEDKSLSEINLSQFSLFTPIPTLSLRQTDYTDYIAILFASAIPYGNDEAKAHLFSSPPSPPSPPSPSSSSSSSPVCQMEILANWNSQISQDLD